MNINFVVTSKPGDGLLFYSYEYCAKLNAINQPATLCIIPHRHFKPEDYMTVLNDKYASVNDVQFNDIDPKEDDITMIMGRSQLTLAYMTWRDYNSTQKLSLFKLFGNKLISVYSDNHPKEYPMALDYFKPKHVYDLCDTEVYPNGKGEHFEKTINFEIYKNTSMKENDPEIQEYLFLGTNDIYYDAVDKCIDNIEDIWTKGHGVLVYKDQGLDDWTLKRESEGKEKLNHIFAPFPDLLRKFNTYVYTKPNFDPAPRLMIEFLWAGRKVIYQRDKNLKDGGPVYWERGVKDIAYSIPAIGNAIEKLSKY